MSTRQVQIAAVLLRIHSIRTASILQELHPPILLDEESANPLQSIPFPCPFLLSMCDNSLNGIQPLTHVIILEQLSKGVLQDQLTGSCMKGLHFAIQGKHATKSVVTQPERTPQIHAHNTRDAFFLALPNHSTLTHHTTVIQSNVRHIQPHQMVTLLAHMEQFPPTTVIDSHPRGIATIAVHHHTAVHSAEKEILKHTREIHITLSIEQISVKTIANIVCTQDLQ